jgi:hypothetical protein
MIQLRLRAFACNFFHAKLQTEQELRDWLHFAKKITPQMHRFSQIVCIICASVV